MTTSEKISYVKVHTAPMALSWLTDSLIASPMSRHAAVPRAAIELVR